MNRSLIAALALALLAGGCATAVPRAQNFPPAQQKKAMAAQHWGMIAADAVTRTREVLARQHWPSERPLYVADTTRSAFERAFRNYLITELVNAGIAVSPQRDGAIELQYETQVIRHAAAFDPAAVGYKPGMAGAATAGFWVLRDAFRTWPSGGAAAATVGGALAYDAYRASHPGETGVELLLTLTIVQYDRYLLRSTDAYYLERGDAWLFEPCRSRGLRACR